jgi:hypothetical protein
MDERYTLNCLTMEGGLATDFRRKTWIFDTATGKRVHYFEGSRYCSLVFSEAEDKFWEVDYRYENTWWRYVNTSDEDSKTLFRPELRYQRADLNTYDEKSGTFIHQRVWFRHASTRHTTGLGFGGDRKLCFRIEHSAQEPSRDGGSEDLFARMGIAPLAPDVDNSYPGAGELVESGSVASVTLPVKSRNRATRRREFEASLLGKYTMEISSVWWETTWCFAIKTMSLLWCWTSGPWVISTAEDLSFASGASYLFIHGRDG